MAKITPMGNCFQRLVPGSVFNQLLFILVVISFTHCKNKLVGDPGNGGLLLPGNFEALVVIDSLGPARHLAVNENGDIYVKLNKSYSDGDNAAISVNSQGKAAKVLRFGDSADQSNYGRTGMRIHDGYLYYSSASTVFRQKLSPGKLIPDTETEVILTDDYVHDPHGHSHIAKAVAFDNSGRMFVPFGSSTDICQVLDRIPESPGQQPCPQLAEHAGIWSFDPNKQHQTIKDGTRYATGVRSTLAISWNPDDKDLYIVQHGRDDLTRTWPALYSPWQSALLPSEEFMRIKEGSDAGWPYYYYDQMQGKKLLNPEYGGDGKKTGKGNEYVQPLIGFPGHWAPNDLVFYQGDQFPEHYKHGAFIAFHGSAIRAPYSQSGYIVAFVPFEKGHPSGPWEVFADGFAGVDTIVNMSDAKYRPMGLSVGPDGSLYVSDSEKGRIWRIMYKGDKAKFGIADLAEMEKRKMSPHIKTPDEVSDNLQKDIVVGGQKLYGTYCGLCHQRNGKGDASRFPPLDSSEWVNGDKKRLIGIVTNGMQTPIVVKGRTYNNVMPAHNFLKDEQLASILTYIRKSFGNNADSVTAKEVSRVRLSSHSK